jgi:hypothetical protein
MLARTDADYRIEPPNLLVESRNAVTIPVPKQPPTLAEEAVEVYQQSLQRSTDLLLQKGHEREAVQEVLWLLESVATAFRDVDTETGTIEGSYFNQIVRQLRQQAGQGTALNNILNWLTTMHGYLSAPAGGGVRHGVDLKRGIAISPSEARLYCNLTRSYLGFLLEEHERLVKTGRLRPPTKTKRR